MSRNKINTLIDASAIIGGVLCAGAILKIFDSLFKFSKPTVKPKIKSPVRTISNIPYYDD